jgi:hypothetical protein
VAAGVADLGQDGEVVEQDRLGLGSAEVVLQRLDQRGLMGADGGGEAVQRGTAFGQAKAGAALRSERFLRGEGGEDRVGSLKHRGPLRMAKLSWETAQG